MDIMTGGKLSYIMVANIIIFYFAVRSSKSVRGEWGKGMDGGIVILPATCFTLLEYLVIWYKIQVIINPLL